MKKLEQIVKKLGKKAVSIGLAALLTFGSAYVLNGCGSNNSVGYVTEELYTPTDENENTGGENMYNEKCIRDYLLNGPSEFDPSEIHEGDIILEDEVMIIENKDFLQKGNIYLNGKSKLIIKDSKFAVERGDVPTVHVYFFVDDEASLEINNSYVFPRIMHADMAALLIIRTPGKTKIIDSPTSIHLIEMYENSDVTIENSDVVYEIGGLLQVTGGDAKVINSTIGAIGLNVPANAELELDGLSSGNYFDYWNVNEMIKGVDYSLTFENSCILRDDWVGEYAHGPFERGWQFFLDPDAHVRIRNSELRKAFIHLENEDVTFENLRVGELSNLKYKDILLEDVIMRAQWPFTIINSNARFINSNYLFLQSSGESNIYLDNSHIAEFIPRDFLGTLYSENGLWANAGEIIGGQEYHSSYNNFSIKGSITMGDGNIGDSLRDNLQWKNATVAREYDLIVDADSIEIDGRGYSVSNNKVKFEILFDENNYDKPHILEIYSGSDLVLTRDIDFFTKTPIVIE